MEILNLNFNLATFLFALPLCLAACYITLIIYRLTFHPLARFPGPKLTAATYLIELYHELLHGEGGQFPFAYRKWHDQYGPIIRITPDELHVRDSEWYEYFYSPSRPTRKVPNFGYRFQIEESVLGAEDPKVYRPRRAALNPFFSKRRVGEFAGEMQKRTYKLLERLREDYAGGETGKVFSVTKMWSCFATDNAVAFAFDLHYDLIDSPGFVSTFDEARSVLAETVHVTSLAPVAYLMRLVPQSLLASLNPKVKSLLQFFDDIAVQVNRVLESHAKGEKLGDKEIFSSLVEESEHKSDLTFNRLHQDGKMVVAAGGESITRSLAVATFYLLNQPETKGKLFRELEDAIPDPANMPDWKTLSELPYLSACIEEALRLTYGLSERRARAYDAGTLTYKDWVIPQSTFVSMDNYDVAHDEAIFPNSYSFIPERWLNDPKAPDGKNLTRYMVSFGKGMRNCIGMQFAYAEMYIGLATFFGSELGQKAKLFETKQEDTIMARCVFVPEPKRSSQGVRAVFEP